MSSGIVNLSECFDAKEAGNKAVNLGSLLRAGFYTAPGFVILAGGVKNKQTLEAAAAAWREMGGVAVAVRSSSAAEDAGGHSMAGQHETALNVGTEESLLNAIERCVESASNGRTRAYLAKQGMGGGNVAMAVIVQKMVEAKKAGVLFTADPRSGDRDVFVIEAARGLGDAVVSGSVKPDEIRMDRLSGKILSAKAGSGGLCLTSDEVHQLWVLGRRIADHFGAEQDIEFAIADGEPVLLQSRPITTLFSAVGDEKRELLRLLDEGRGPWAAHNLGETLENPTPLTWSMTRRFMAGDGGYGSMLKLAGFEPSARICKEGFLKLISGRIYMDLSVAGEMFFADCPYEYDLEAVRRDPEAGQNPPTKASGSFRRRAAFSHRLGEAHARIVSLSKDFDLRLEKEIIPGFVEYCAKEKERDLGAMSNAELAELWLARCARVLDEFAPQSLMPGLIGAQAMENLRKLIEEWVWDESARRLAMELSAATEMDQTMSAGSGLYAVGRGERALDDWLSEHGHRGPREMELAAPRWRQCADDVLAMARALSADPAERHKSRVEATERTLSRILKNLPVRAKSKIRAAVQLVRKCLLYRETGKHYLMMGYELLRDTALEAGRRLGVGDGIFFLEQDEMLEALEMGLAPVGLIHQRMGAWKSTASAKPQRVIGREELENRGGEEPLEQGSAICAGVATGEAFVAHDFETAKGMKKGDILVCPRTDPAWTPLFAMAGGLVIEQGGVLSHGAIVAREMNIPAVVLPGATSRFKTGERIVVDGNRGVVGLESCIDEAATADDGPAPSEIPPVSGEDERCWNRLALIVAAIWGVYLALFFLADWKWVRFPTMRVMDFVFWPMVREYGKPAAMAIIAGASAAAVILFQRFFTDNRRLLECKRRVRMLEKAAQKLPKGSPNKIRLLDMTFAPTVRFVLASFVPLGLLLGPLMMTFTWMQSRMDGANWNMPPGKAVEIVLKVKADKTAPVGIEIPRPLELTTDCPAKQSIRPIKTYLEGQLAKWRGEKSADPLMDPIRQQTMNDLENYLKNPGVPPQELRWSVETAGARAGVYPVTVRMEQGEAATVNLILGDAAAPELSPPTLNPEHFSSLAVEYVQEKQPFFRPLKKIGISWDIGWLGVYLLAYLPAMAVVRWIARPA